MNKQSLYLTLDHENGLVMGIGKSYQNSKRSSEIVLEKAVILSEAIPDEESARVLFTTEEVQRFYEEYSSDMKCCNEYKIRKAGIIFQFVEQLDYL
tara:strand:+ start:1289 stop:1576 length:288 start_codon:yes stop_codon:yes gene_type:complete